MKNRSLKKLIVPGLSFMFLFASFQAHGLQRTGSVERLINSCQQELQTLCSRMNEPREAVICLRENEPQLQTRECIEEMRLLNRAYNNVPLPTEEPFINDVNEIQ